MTPTNQTPDIGDIERLLNSYNEGKLDEAERTASKLVKAYPNDAFSWKALGAILERRARYEEALLPLKRTIQLNPNDYEAYFNLGIVEKKLGHTHDAAASFRESIRLKPNYSDAYFNLAIILMGSGDTANAVASFKAAIALKPNLAAAYNYLACCLVELAQFDEALDYYNQAIDLNPNFFEAYNNLGNVQQALGRSDEALKSYNKVLEINPSYAPAHSNRGNVLQELRHYDQALSAYDSALEYQPNNEIYFSSRQTVKMQICDWSDFDQTIARYKRDIYSGICLPPWHILSMSDDPKLNRLNAELWNREKFPDKRSHRIKFLPKSNEKLRIGYFSADFHNHATMHLMAELFESHDKNQFEIYGFSFGPDIRDAMRARAVRSFDKFLDVRAISDQGIAELSRQLNIDIAVDLKGYSQHSRPGVFAQGCAPIQVNYLGFPGSIGADYINYIIADKTVIPPENRCYFSETVVYLPDSYLVTDSKCRISDRIFSRAEFGLPNGSFVFACFNNNYKIHPKIFDSWMRILTAVQGSVLWLLEDNPTAAKNLRAEATARNVDPTRLIFCQRTEPSEHLARHRLADIFLDTLPFNAHTTASDALWAGLPVLTLMGNSFAGRVASSLLNSIGLPEMITLNQQEYESKAIELASTPQILHKVKEKLAEHRLSTPLFDGVIFARRIEAVYKKIYSDYWKNQERTDQ
jgi:predicted O-linked N-acetylglucosamine transferase (SPINDLY family)